MDDQDPVEKKNALALNYLINLQESEIMTSLETKYFLTQLRTERNAPIVSRTKSMKIHMERNKIQSNKQNILAESLSLH